MKSMRYSSWMEKEWGEGGGVEMLVVWLNCVVGIEYSEGVRLWKCIQIVVLSNEFRGVIVQATGVFSKSLVLQKTSW